MTEKSILDQASEGSMERIKARLGERPDRKIRLHLKDDAVRNIARTNLVKNFIKVLVRVDDFLQEVATLELEITPDNIVSSSVRKLFGLTLPVEPPPPASNVKNAKSKWHEIILKAEKATAEQDEERRQRKDRIRQAMSETIGGIPLREHASDILKITKDEPLVSTTKSTDTLVNGSEAVGDTSQHADVLNK